MTSAFWTVNASMRPGFWIHRRSQTRICSLAAAHGGQLATFDGHLVTNAVMNGAKALHLIA
jgi:hypothetical protein